MFRLNLRVRRPFKAVAIRGSAAALEGHCTGSLCVCSIRNLFWIASLIIFLLAGCQRDMEDQARLEPYEPNDFFTDGLTARPLVPGTVARGLLRLDTALYEGRVGNDLVREFPIELTRETLLRGQERYVIYCSPCHDRAGYGQGMVVQRGFPPAQSLHTDRLREMPPGHYFEVITQGFGRMPSYADQIPPVDRWAIVAYVQALQLSQYAPADELPESTLRNLPSRSP